MGEACSCRKNGLKCSEMCGCCDCSNRSDNESNGAVSESESSDGDIDSEDSVNYFSVWESDDGEDMDC